MRPRRRMPAALLAALALTLGAAACGDDEDTGTTDTSIPTVTIPEDTTTAPTSTTTESTTTDETDTGGTTTFDPNQDDSPTNDKPRAPGSPEDQFEKDCQQNPGKCG
jgi:ABC-type glycerol-3-phosphate transport system substrate-binding protein